MIKFCKRCLYSNTHPLGLTFDHEGICSGCRIHEEKDKLDWAERWEKLKAIIKPYRNKDGKNYDCIVPVTGGQDSYYIVYLAKVLLGLNPLLVTYNKYFNTPLGINNLANLKIRFNCDLLYQNVNPLSVKKITRTTLRKLGSIYWPILAGHTVFPVQTAVRFKIPLIIWGAHQGIEQVGMFSHLHEVEMTRRYRKDHDLMGYEADDLLSVFDTLKEEDIWQYRYPSKSALETIGVRGIYLGNFIRWDPLAQHKQMAKTHGFKSAKLGRTFDIFDHTDDLHYTNLHDFLKVKKHGYGKAFDQACREIRHGRLDRSHALSIANHFSNQPVQYSDIFFEWLGHICLKSFDWIVKRNEKAENLTLEQYHDSSNSGCINFSASDLVPSSSLFMGAPPKQIIVGKGWPDIPEDSQN